MNNPPNTPVDRFMHVKQTYDEQQQTSQVHEHARLRNKRIMIDANQKRQRKSTTFLFGQW
jgi:hypothetical protein